MENVKLNEWFFEDETEKEMGIETINYENGGKSKKATLSNGKVAISRRLKGKDHNMIRRITNNDKDLTQDAIAALSTKIDEKDIVIEDLQELWYPDYTKVQTMASSINFI